MSEEMMLKKVYVAIRRALGQTIAGRDLQVYPDDTFIVSYPRSGNTWLRFLVGNLLHPEETVTFANIEQIVPDIYQNTHQDLTRLPRPRILKSHEYFDPRYKRVVYLVRDPRDVAVSYYHYNQKIGRIPDAYPWSEFVPRFLAGQLDPFGSWKQHVGSWLGAKEGGEDFLLIRYRDLIQDPAHELDKVASFLSVDATTEYLERVVELSSISRMRHLERQQHAIWRPTRHSREDKPFIRVAQTGAWKNELPDDAAAEIGHRWGPLLQALGFASPSNPDGTRQLQLERDACHATG